MGRGGQNRLPDNVKRLRGTLDKRTSGKGPNLRARRVPRAPATLPPEQRAIWRELARQVDALRVYTEADYSSFRLLVQTLALVEAASQETDPFKRMPATALVRLVQAAHTSLAQFGMSPATRGRVQAAAPSLSSALEEFRVEEDLFGPAAKPRRVAGPK